MAFQSILFEEREASPAQEAHAHCKDLNIDQIVSAIAAGWKEKDYDLKPLFYSPLRSVDAIEYRQQIMHDLECEPVLQAVKAFARTIYLLETGLQSTRKYLLSQDAYYCNYLQKGRLLEAAAAYCTAIDRLAQEVSAFDLHSRGLTAFREYMAFYRESVVFTALRSETESMRADLSAVHYCMLIRGGAIKVRKYEGEEDHTAQIEAIFERFKQGDVKDYRRNLIEEPYAEHVEAGVLNLVAKLYPEVFAKLDLYCQRNLRFMDETIHTFSKEVQFYIVYLEYIARFKRGGLHFCYPRMGRSKEISNTGGFDMALADQLIGKDQPVVCNDFYLKGTERIIVVSGPNQGGKTTFARAFGQLHHFASLGCPVPGTQAELFVFDEIFTHFEKEEDIHNLSGKLQDDLIRMNNILGHATPDSIIIINEILSSTSLQDAVEIGKKIMERVVRLDALCVVVTFLDELASYSEKNVSMISTVIPEDPARRTFKIVRKPADGLAYAMHIASKYRLTYDCLKERIRA